MRAAIITLLVILLAAPILAAPSKPTVEVGSGSVAISGSLFSTRSGTPNYFSNFDADTLNTTPARHTWGTGSNGYNYSVPVKNNLAHSGGNSIEFDYCNDAHLLTWNSGVHYHPNEYVSYSAVTYRVINDIPSSSTVPPSDAVNYVVESLPTPHCSPASDNEDWKRDGIDLGAGADKIYFSAWVYLDKGESTCSSWQWKSFNVSSNSIMYYDLPSEEQINTTSQQTNYWYNSATGWNNTHAYGYHWDGARQTLGVSSGAPSDALLWGQWQRLEFYAQRSSASATADGIWYEQRIGRSTPTVNITTAKNWYTGNNPWRYVALSHATASAYGGYLDLKIYMDDIYIDTTQARVELCDSATWAARTHCEIQPPTAWSATGITATFNQGSFTEGATVYFFVVDADGAVSPASDPHVIGAASPSTHNSGSPKGRLTIR